MALGATAHLAGGRSSGPRTEAGRAGSEIAGAEEDEVVRAVVESPRPILVVFTGFPGFIHPGLQVVNLTTPIL
ncbi:hypothetical protein DICSQDRAFT_166240 [Dichomitus squalens LYAD-421 SS1]|uniref:uncharacterized protein n=1 Tax=Dichomitus squalens (strain LYAD-421) TaxID=732165 RepID=UPI0004411844|nr:uncharacterized protein DICSQDRAFT_166240 [Dichomitus squalens LYAD-421 SS1]EJF65187.1 hypothetical protein DICSQDRAFT_166240 [Dichomitus squalens LYAD-421 SS1]